MPAITMAPRRPDRTISSILSSSASGDDGTSWDMIMMSSLQWRGAKRVGIACGNRGSMVAPGNTDIGHDRCDFVVRERLGERRHSVRHRVASRARRITAIKNHPNRIDGRGHLDRLIAGEWRIVGNLSLSLGAVTARTFVAIYGLPEPQQQAAFVRRHRG